MLKKLSAALASLALVLLLPFAAAAPAHAAGGHFYHVTNSMKKYLGVCEDWSGTTSDPGCKYGSRYETVVRGSWSTFPDADGVVIPDGCLLFSISPLRSQFIAEGPRQQKLVDGTYHLQLRCG